MTFSQRSGAVILTLSVLLIGCGISSEGGDTAAITDVTTEPLQSSTLSATADSVEDLESSSTTSEVDSSSTTSAATTTSVVTTTSELPTTSVVTTTSEIPTTSEPETTSELPIASEAPPIEAETTTATQADPPTEVIGGPARALGPASYVPFAVFDDVTLVHPSLRVEQIGFHESNHDGARQLEPTDTAFNVSVMESRERDTGSRTAADIVVEPGTEIRSPVTGTVKRAGGYVLYCDHSDDFLVIEPDTHPGWEVKLLHISGVTVSAGDRVEAGVTVIAPRATEFPFESQIDELTAEPSWPHVHIELVDPSIPDRPSTGGGC